MGFNGHIVGIDTTEEFLKKACSLASNKSLANRVTFKKADASKLPFHENTFDWAASMDFIGYGNQDPTSFLREVARVVKPGGMVFLYNTCAPLTTEMRIALGELFEMRWEEARLEVSPEDWTEYQRLCNTESPDFILNVPDYYAFITYSLFCGKVV